MRGDPGNRNHAGVGMSAPQVGVADEMGLKLQLLLLHPMRGPWHSSAEDLGTGSTGDRLWDRPQSPQEEQPSPLASGTMWGWES